MELHEQSHRLNVIIGGSPPCNESVRSVKEFRRKAITAKRWPATPKTSPQITFSAEDTVGIHMPHNDSLLIDIGISDCTVTKVLIDTGSSVDLIFKSTLVKMGVSLNEMKPSVRTLTGFNGSSETMLGTIRLRVYAEGVARNVKFSVIDVRAPYNAILGTPWLHSMKAIPSTYHQCIKFPGNDGRIITLRGDQAAARDLLVVDVKHQKATSHVNTVAKPIQKIYPLRDEILEIVIDDTDKAKTVHIGAYLPDEMKDKLISFLKDNVSTFAWSTADMKGIDHTITTHELNVDPTFKPIRQKRRKLGPDRSKAVNEEVERLLGAGSITEVKYPEWLANPVVKKKNGKWRVCVDFTDLNKACPKDSFPLPHIDRLVESTSGNELLTFMDAFSGYNQIMMHPDDREKTAFITDRGIYCYKVMPFGLKNAGATYQRLVNRMFADRLGVTMEVYIDDMLVKSPKAADHIDHLKDCFLILNEYGMKLNPAKCTFGVTSGEFLGYIVTQRGIEANPKQISAILDIPSPKNSREVQRLTGRIAALNRFISRSTDKCLPFYDLLRGNKKFIWDERCEEAFDQLKRYLTTPPVLAKPDKGDTLYLYIAVSNAAVSSVLVKEDRGEQRPIFYISQRMTDAETRYSTLEKMAFAVRTSTRKLRPYFQSHSIVVLTNFPLRTIMQNANHSGRLSKWAIELSEYDVTFQNRPAAKSQVLADFLIELTPELEQDLKLPSDDWILHVDGSSSIKGSGVGVHLQSPTGELLRQSFRLGFKASNNEAEYEAQIAGLRLARAVQAKRIHAYCDSQLVANQFSGDYDAKNERMDAYLKVVQDLTREFESFKLTRIPRGENVCADALAALGSSPADQVKRTIPIQHIDKPSITLSHDADEHVAAIDAPTAMDTSESIDQPDDSPPDWRIPFIRYLSNGEVPENKWEARRLKAKCANYVLIDGRLHRWTSAKVLLTCLNTEEAALAMAETHEGGAGNHSGGRSLALKVKKDGFYLPTMIVDCDNYARRCDKCQRHASDIHCPTELLQTSTAPYPFMRWAMDLVGPMPSSRQRKYILIMTDYFTKWVEAKALVNITDKEVQNFVWKNIICRHGLPYEIVTDNGSQFISGDFRGFLERWGIRLNTSTPRNPQSNGQAEATNKTIIAGIKKRLDLKKGHWADELDGVLCPSFAPSTSGSVETVVVTPTSDP